jgi:hypothetical protein
MNIRDDRQSPLPILSPDLPGAARCLSQRKSTSSRGADLYGRSDDRAFDTEIHMHKILSAIFLASLVGCSAGAIAPASTPVPRHRVGITQGEALPVNAVAAADAGTIISATADPSDSALHVHIANLADGGTIPTQEQLAPQAEDNVNGVLAIALKPLAVSTYSPSLFTNFAANATLNVKASAGNVFSVGTCNANASTRYIQVHNTATTPSGGATPLLSFPVLASACVQIGADVLTWAGVYFSTGIAFAFSTTQSTYTAGSAADQNTTILFK